MFVAHAQDEAVADGKDDADEEQVVEKDRGELSICVVMGFSHADDVACGEGLVSWSSGFDVWNLRRQGRVGAIYILAYWLAKRISATLLVLLTTEELSGPKTKLLVCVDAY